MTQMTDYELDRYYNRKWLVPDWAYFVFAGVIVGWFISILAVLTIVEYT